MRQRPGAVRISGVFTYTNRKGVTYFLHAITTKRGATRYTLKRSDDRALDALPEGYEVVESVNGQASVRRRRPRAITEQEEAIVREKMGEQGLSEHRLEIKDKQIIIYEPDQDADYIAERLGGMGISGFGAFFDQALRERVGNAVVDQWIAERTNHVRKSMAESMTYSPIMRFVLLDKTDRRFGVDRMTYRGEGGWRRLNHLPLVTAASMYVPHIGEDSFFELI